MGQILQLVLVLGHHSLSRKSSDSTKALARESSTGRQCSGRTTMPRRSRRWARNARPRRCAEPQRRARRERRRTAELWGNCGSAAPCVHHYVSRARTDIMPNRATAAAARHPSREASSPISYHLCCVRARARRVEILVAQHPGTGRGVQHRDRAY
jgi:hypothetical protein